MDANFLSSDWSGTDVDHQRDFDKDVARLALVVGRITADPSNRNLRFDLGQALERARRSWKAGGVRQDQKDSAQAVFAQAKQITT